MTALVALLVALGAAAGLGCVCCLLAAFVGHDEGKGSDFVGPCVVGACLLGGIAAGMIYAAQALG